MTKTNSKDKTQAEADLTQANNPRVTEAVTDPSLSAEDEFWMRQALQLAQQAADRGEVPVGAVLVQDGEILAEAANWREGKPCPTAHAELMVIQAAAQKLKRWRLSGCTLYVTLEPCAMCAGAIVQARLDRVVYGATDAKAGAVESLYQILSDPRLNHQPQVVKGVLADECGQLLSEFFKNLRQKKKKLQP